MKKFSYLKTSALALALLILPLGGKADSSIIGLGIVPKVFSWPGVDDNVLGVRLSLVGLNRTVRGIDAGAINITKESMGGLQVGAINIVGGRATIVGAQIGVGANWNRGETYGVGVQIAALINRNTRRGSFAGLQAALVNHSGRTAVYGLQAGLVNYAAKVRGLQIGLINKAESLKGVQIGLVNIHSKGTLKWIPIINIGFR